MGNKDAGVIRQNRIDRPLPVGVLFVGEPGARPKLQLNGGGYYVSFAHDIKNDRPLVNAGIWCAHGLDTLTNKAGIELLAERTSGIVAKKSLDSAQNFKSFVKSFSGLYREITCEPLSCLLAGRLSKPPDSPRVTHGRQEPDYILLAHQTLLPHEFPLQLLDKRVCLGILSLIRRIAINRPGQTSDQRAIGQHCGVLPALGLAGSIFFPAEQDDDSLPIFASPEFQVPLVAVPMPIGGEVVFDDDDGGLPFEHQVGNVHIVEAQAGVHLLPHAIALMWNRCRRGGGIDLINEDVEEPVVQVVAAANVQQPGEDVG